MNINGLMTTSSKSSQFCPWHIWHLPRSPEKFHPDRPAPAAATGEAPPAQPPWWWGHPCSEHQVLGDFPLSFEDFLVVFWWSMYDVWVILDVFVSKVANWTNWSRFGDFDGPNIGAYPPKLSCNSKPSHNRGTWPLITMINIDHQSPVLLLLQGILQIQEAKIHLHMAERAPHKNMWRADGWQPNMRWLIIICSNFFQGLQ